MNLGIRDPRKVIEPKPISKDEWTEYKSMLKLAGKHKGKSTKKSKTVMSNF